MDAGKEMDVLVAEKVMGLRVCRDLGFKDNHVLVNKEGFVIGLVEGYSTNIGSAWKVIDHFLDLHGNEDSYYLRESFFAYLDTEGHGALVRWRSEHAAITICSAALLAVGVPA